MRSRGRHSAHRHTVPGPARTVPLAALALVAGIVFVQFANGHAPRTILDHVAAGTATVAPAGTPSAEPVPFSGATGPVTSGSATGDARTIAAPQPRAVCRHVVHLGDSNLGIIAAQFKDAYAAMGLDAVLDWGNGRGATIVEDGTTALAAINRFRGSVPAGQRCWVVQLSAADAVDASRRGADPSSSIRTIADAIGEEPVLWITPVLVSTTTDWTLDASTAYNRALLQVAANRPNITVLDWQDIALGHLDEFRPDGVHYQEGLYRLFVQTVTDKIRAIWTVPP